PASCTHSFFFLLSSAAPPPLPSFPTRRSSDLIERLVDSGQAVHEGQPLMRLDRTDYTHAITSQVGNVDAARARLQQAAADEARYSGLVSSGAVSRSAYDQVKAAADSARALLSA